MSKKKEITRFLSDVDIQHLLDSLNTGIVNTDRYGRIIYLNKSASELLGIEEKDAYGKKLDEILGEIIEIQPCKKGFLMEHGNKVLYFESVILRKYSGKPKSLCYLITDKTQELNIIEGLFTLNRNLAAFVDLIRNSITPPYAICTDRELTEKARFDARIFNELFCKPIKKIGEILESVDEIWKESEKLLAYSKNREILTYKK